ncbi:MULTISPECIES: AAA family ATPase [unclassified Novosphingobium]|uniref:GumC family protein n=1 Tax=unclassified Novosphingobium TaxID=2644732 RepID=UPI000F5F234C|nr:MULTISPECIES: AAA family ATPase [unclassified Novosphingobium]QCI93133.1 chain-length determining protein [Novosphingobium sp. EMRT-2]RQW43905.1 chain-length determining protein [Novosphingobium sp. LASN5T]
MEVTHQNEAPAGRFSDFVQSAQDTLRRRWLTLVIVTVAITVAGVAGISLITPRYTAAALIRIDPSRNPLNNKQPQEALSPESIETEVAVLSSTELAQRVVKALKLENDPELLESVRKAGNVSGDRDAALASALLDRLSVSRDKLTYLISVGYTSEDPQKAARVANAVAEGYLDLKVNTSTGTAARQADWFREQLDKLAAEMRAADEQVAQYRAQAGLAQGSGSNAGTIVDQQVGPLSSQLAMAESDAAAARAALSTAERQIQRGNLDSVEQVRNSPVINDLRRQRAEILRNQGEVEARYGPRHPESIRVRDQLASIDQQIRDEAERAVASLRANTTAVEARAGSLRSTMGRVAGEQASNTRAAVIADSLERDAAAKRAAYDRMSQMWLESTQASQNQISQAVIVNRADVPTKPTFPKRLLMSVLSLVVGLAAGIATIIFQEMMVRGLRTIDDVESTLGLPVLAAVPKLPRSSNPGRTLLEKPTSLFSESFRIARAAILGVKSAKPPKIIAFTSALPSEGKTTSSLSFARTLALNGSRVILVDCDVRRAQVRHIVENPGSGPGLVEVLHGTASEAEAIHPGDVEGMDQLLVSAPYFSSEDLFGNDGMVTLLNKLSDRYDFVVLDLPPLVGLADGRFLAAMADATVLAVRWASTPPQAAASAVNWLQSDGSNPIGVIYTMVDSAAEAIGGLYYSKKYTQYYRAAA